MKIALVGAGAFGLKHLDGLRDIEGVSVAAIVSGDLRQARDAAAEYDVPDAMADLD